MQVRTMCQNKPLSTSGPSSSLSSAASECCFSPYRIFSLRTQQLMPEGLTFPAPARELSFRLPLPLRSHSASCQRPPKSLETPSFSDSGNKMVSACCLKWGSWQVIMCHSVQRGSGCSEDISSWDETSGEGDPCLERGGGEGGDVNS